MLIGKERCRGKLAGGCSSFGTVTTLSRSYGMGGMFCAPLVVGNKQSGVFYCKHRRGVTAFNHECDYERYRMRLLKIFYGVPIRLPSTETRSGRFVWGKGGRRRHAIRCAVQGARHAWVQLSASYNRNPPQQLICFPLYC